MIPGLRLAPRALLARRSRAGLATLSRVEALRQELARDDLAGATVGFDDAVVVKAAPKAAAKKKKRGPPRPQWIRTNAATSPKYKELKATVRRLGLATVCEEAQCPNIGECWNGGTGTVSGVQRCVASRRVGWP